MSFSANGKLMWDSDQFAKPLASAQAITGVYARYMLDLTNFGLQHASPSRLMILDNACGSGAVTTAIQDLMRSTDPESFHITATDLADAMVASTKDMVQKHGWTNTEVLKRDAQDTKLPSNHFTHVFTNFGPMLFPEPSRAISECYRMLKSGGVCAFTTWQEVGWIEDVTAAIKTIPHLPALPEVIDFSNGLGTGKWGDEGFIESFMRAHGFHDVSIKGIPNTTIAKNLEELKPVLDACVTIFVKILWTQKQQEELDTAALRKQIEVWFKEKYDEGSIEWQWKALITTCVKPD